MAKKRHRAKQIGQLDGQAINIPDRMLSENRPIEINVVSEDGEIVRKSFPRSASGWKASVKFACNVLTFRESILSGVEFVPKWFRKFAIAEGLLESHNDPTPEQIARNRLRYGLSQ